MLDGELVRQTLDGDRDAYGELVRRHTPRLLAVCHARVRRPDMAEELAQESLYRAYKALPTLQEPEKFAGWAAGIATRVCLDWLKAAERKNVPFSALDDESDADPPGAPDDRGPSLEDREECDRLMREVERLPDKHREALMAYYYQDCTYEELARQLDVSAATVNARLTQARQMLRERLAERPSRKRVAER